VGRGLTPYVRVVNLLDKFYQDALGYPALGREARVGMNYRFGGKKLAEASERQKVQRKCIRETEAVLFCWSGGKDSAMALHVLRQAAGLRIAALLTTVTDGYDRISMHGVRRTLLLRQAAALGCRCTKCEFRPSASIQFTKSECAMLCSHRKRTVFHCVAFGDIFLQDLREYRERNLAQVEIDRHFSDLETRDERTGARFLCIGISRYRGLCPIRKSSVANSPAGNWTNRSSATCPQAWMPVVKTESFIPSSTTARFLERDCGRTRRSCRTRWTLFCDLKGESEMKF